MRKIIPLLFLLFQPLCLFSYSDLEKVPLSIDIPYSFQFVINRDGISFLSYQVKHGLESKGLKKKIVDALEGLTFQSYMPVIGGKLTFTILGKGDDSYDGVRYNRTLFTITTEPPEILRKSVSMDELYPILTVTADAEGNHPEIDLKIEHKLFTINKVTIQADMEVAGILHVMTTNNQLRIATSKFKSRLLYLYVPYVQLPQIPGLPGNLMHRVEKAFNDYLSEAILQFFEKDINRALAQAIKSALDKLIFDRDEDGIPDPLLDLNKFFSEGNSFLGTHLLNNLNFNVEIFREPPQILIKSSGSIFSNYISSSTLFPQEWFYYTHIEEDGCYGEDPPVFPDKIPGSQQDYMAGIALSDDTLNQILTSIYNEGLINNFHIDTSTLTNIDPQYREYLTTKVFKLLNMEAFYRAFPDKFLAVDLQLRKSPYIFFSDKKSIKIVMPSVKIDIYASDRGSYFRLFSVMGDIDSTINIKQISLEEKPFLIFTISPQINLKVTYNEIAPELNRDIENTFLPLVSGAISQALPGLVDGFSLPLTTCIEGLEVKDLTMENTGKNEDNLYNYMMLFFNLEGTMDLDKFLTECLNISLFAPPVTSFTPAVLPESKIFRINGGFWLESRDGKWWKELPPGTYIVTIPLHGKLVSFKYTKSGTSTNKEKAMGQKYSDDSEGCSEGGDTPFILLLAVFIIWRLATKYLRLTKKSVTNNIL